MMLTTFSVKRIIMIIGLLIFSGSSVFAQHGIEIAPFYGYQFSGSIPTSKGKANIKDSDDYGVAVNVPIPMRGGIELELLFLHADTRVEVLKYDYGVVVDRQTFDLSYEYYQLGSMKTIRVPGKNVVPFGGLTLGASRYHPKSTSRKDEWFFSATLGAGVKIYPSEKVGLRLQGRLLLPFQWGGGSLWCGTGGCSIGVGTTSVFLSGDLTAGLIIRL
jgi:opacity protein-like surface antigen